MATVSKSIYIIEDEPMISKILELKTSSLYDRVQVFSNGNDGWEAIKENKPDLIILDVMLPGMNGFEILDKVKSNEGLSETKVLMLTAKAREEDVERGFMNKADEFMSKPFKMNELILRIQKLLS